MIYIATDHAGLELKNRIVSHLRAKDIAVEDLGAREFDPNDDYPDVALKLVKKMSTIPEYSTPGVEYLGILICGSGQGMCIAANRFSKVRAAQAWSVASARVARSDDDANVLCLAGRLKNSNSELDIVDAFLGTPFKNEAKYLRRINKLTL